MDSVVRFEPWVGERYGSDDNPFGVRLLLVGESMYERHPGSLTSRIVPDMIGSIVRGEWKHRFYTTLRRTVGPEQELRSFWHGLAFYNFVQVPVGDGPRQRPSEQAWAQSREAFVAVLTSLAPQAVLFLGRQLWWQASLLRLVIPSAEGVGRTLAGHEAEAAGINHPSSRGFTPGHWAERIAGLLDRARRSIGTPDQLPEL